MLKQQKSMSGNGDVVKYMFLEFTNARKFTPHPQTTDRIFHSDGTVDVRSFTYEALVPPRNIMNSLAVLFNERPEPLLRYVPYELDNSYQIMALSSFIKITSIHEIVLKDGKVMPIKEVIHTAKYKGNSYKGKDGVHECWYYLDKFIPDKHFTWFIDSLNELLGMDVRAITVPEVRYHLVELIEKEKVIIDTMLKTTFRGDDKTPIGKFINETYERGLGTIVQYIRDSRLFSKLTTTKKGGYRFLSLRGMEFCQNVSGELIVPLTQEQYERLEKSTGTTGILDDGFVWITKISDPQYVNVDGFTSVNDISNKKVFVKTKKDN